MKKNIIIALLAITTITSLIFGLYQKTEAGRYKALADQNAIEAMHQRELAQEQMHLAEEQQRMTMVVLERTQMAVKKAEEMWNKKKK